MVNQDIIIDGNTSFENNPRYDFKNEILYDSFYSEILRDFEINCNYCNENEASNFLKNITSDYFSLLSLNCQSLNAKFSEIKNLISMLEEGGGNIDILTLSETWVKELLTFNIQGYNVFGNARPSGRGGGGTCIYVKKDIQAKQLSNPLFFLSNILESTIVEINIRNKLRFLCISIYRPNTSNDMNINEQIESFFLRLAEILEFLDSYKIPIIFAGDFNLDLFKCNLVNHSSLNLLDIFAGLGYIQIVSKASRISNESFSLIDNIFVKDLIPRLFSCNVLLSDISDHFPLLANFKLDGFKPQAPINIPKRIFNNENINSFSHALSLNTWNIVLENESADIAYSLFFEIFSNLFELHFPLTQPRRNKNFTPLNPFMSRALLRCRSKKQLLAKKLKSFPSQFNKDSYNNYRNVYNKTIRHAKVMHYRRQIKDAGKDSRKIWGVLKNTMGVSKKSNKIDDIEIDGIRYSNNVDIANQLNFHFSSIGNRLTPDIPLTDKNFHDFLPQPFPRSFFLFPINALTMRDTIRSIKPKKTTDVNGISMYLLNIVADHISIPLTHIFNLSISSGVFPEGLKISKTIPIFKSGDPSNTDNYRGVSIVDQFSKPFERLISNKLLEYLEENNFFYNKQFGFRKGYSTNHAVLSVINFISKNLKEGKIVLGILLDIRKCFDMLNHEILLEKLYNYGVRGVPYQWFKSYFNGRKQRVFVNGVSSDTLCDILLGVLQGSILGVLLFLIFINDIFMVNSDFIAFIFADDNTSLGAGVDLEDLIHKANRDLARLLEWYNSNELLIHPLKTKTLIFHPPRYNIDLPLSINNELYLPAFLNMNNLGECDLTKISPLRLIPNNDEDSARLLGFHIDSNLNLKSHFKILHKKVSRAVFSLNQMKNLLDKKHLKLLYSSYVKSQIDYCSNLYTLANKGTLKPIFLLQKRAIRIICGVAYKEHTLPLFKAEKILPIADLCKFNALKFMFDYRNGVTPEVFNNVWSLVADFNPYPVRNGDDFFIDQVLPSYLKDHHPLFYFPFLWNNLPSRLKTINNKKEFASSLFEWIIENLNF